MSSDLSRVLLVSPGHRWSTFDAYKGLGRGFEAIGVTCYPYAIEDRLARSRDFIEWSEGDEPAMDHNRVVFLAGEGCVNQALAIRAEAVVVVTGLLFDPRFYILLARARIPVFLFGTESPYNDDFYHRVIPSVAAASTNEARSLANWETMVAQAGSDTRVLHLPLGYDPATHHPGSGADLDQAAGHDVVFVGNMYPSRAAHLAGARWDGIDLGLYGVFEMIASDPEWPLWPQVCGASPAQPSAVVDNEVTAALYTKSKIVLNMFRREKVGKDWNDLTFLEEGDAGESINPRMIEAAAMGCFMISEYRPEVEQVFGDLVPTFRDPAELERLARYYLEHEEEREAMAAQLPAVVESYSYHERAREIAETMNEIRQEMRAPQIA